MGYLGIIQQRDEAAGAWWRGWPAQRRGAGRGGRCWAGEAVLDVWPGGVPPASRKRDRGRLVATMQSADVAAPLRRRAGLLLGGRFGWRPDDLDEFVEIPAGGVPVRRKAGEGGIPYRYWIGKYPVTNCQYARFMEDGGYGRREFWSEEGWRWREREGREEPKFWKSANFGNPIFPVVGVTSHEAEAYCKWLNARGPGSRSAAGSRLPGAAAHRAGMGTRRAGHGWAGVPLGGRVRTGSYQHSRVRRPAVPTAVCTYPEGRSVGRALGHGGKRLRMDVVTVVQPRLFPRAAGRCLARLCGLRSLRLPPRYVPVFFNLDVGFRVVVSPAVSDS